MVSDFSFRSELEDVQVQLAKEIHFRSASFEELINLELNDLDRYACPALVLAASKAGGGIAQNSIDMAAIIQFTFLADKVHHLLTDDDDLPEDRRQFPVLVGDFLYGKFFWGLSQAHLLPYLKPIARMIERMSEGMILRWQVQNQELSHEEWLKIYQKERGFLTGLGARIGADLSGAPEEFKNQCEQFGQMMGMAWAASNDAVSRKFVEDILVEAKSIIDKLQMRFKIAPLYEVYEYMKNQLGRV